MRSLYVELIQTNLMAISYALKIICRKLCQKTAHISSQINLQANKTRGND